jgi:hypothetical protein
MPACKSGLSGNILKDNRAGFYEAACGNGAVLAIKLRSLGARIGHATLGLLHPFRLPRLRSQEAPAYVRYQKSSNQGTEK